MRSQVIWRGFCDLGQEVDGALDGPGDELGEEGDEEREVEEVAGGGELAAVDVDGVAQRLEGVEGDADREHDAAGEGRELEAEERQQVGEALGEEARVLEDAEQREVGDDAGGDEPLAAAGIVALAEGDPDPVVDHGGEQDQAEEAPVPGAVEEVARGQQPAVLGPMRQQPVDRVHQGQKDEERQAVEEHRTRPGTWHGRVGRATSSPKTLVLGPDAGPGHGARREPRSRSARRRPRSPVRMRTASSTGETKILPSPMLPVCAASQSAMVTFSARSSGTTTSSFTLGRKSTTYSAPR